MKVQAIVVAAGSGERLKADVPKPLVLLQGRPLIVYALEVLVKSSLIDSIVLAVSASASFRSCDTGFLCSSSHV